MPKAKGKTRRQKFGYSVNRKRLNRNARRKAAPRIECSHIRHAWDHAKSVRQNLAEMGLAVDPNRAVPLRKRKTWRQKPAFQKRKEILCLGTSLTMYATWWRTTGRTIRPWPVMRRITIKIPQNRFGVRSMFINAFTQRSGKTSSILCGRVRWRLSDWFTSQLPQAEVSPGPVKLEPGCKARRCCVAPEGLARSHGIRRLHTHACTLPALGKELFSEAPIYIRPGVHGKART
ncbi:nucleolar protein 16 isoform X1 [Symphalangus syndactylus]|uniref:nucleolar protein 16 isoform X1 n=1 Tax=Symphalangus syndactylus TaxID=9590 RepID=UPI003007B1DE